jgi:glycosylphosphatidylinositol phospholipase D
MSAYEIDLSFLVDEWYLPSEDLTVIYEMLGFTEVSPDVIDTCVGLLYAEVQAIKNLPSELLYPYFAAQAPFLVDQFQDWWDGGVDDMAIWSTWCWPNIIDWLEVGPNKNVCLIEFNDTYPNL